MAEVWMKGNGFSINNEYLHDMSGWKYKVFILPVFMMHPAAWKYKASCDNKLWKFLVSKSKQNPEIPSKIRNYRLRWTLCLRGFAPNNSDSLTINSFCRNILKPYKLSFKYNSRHYLLSIFLFDPKYCRNCIDAGLLCPPLLLLGCHHYAELFIVELSVRVGVECGESFVHLQHCSAINMIHYIQHNEGINYKYLM